MFGGTLHGIQWITLSSSWIDGRPLGVSNTLEWFSKTIWRYGEMNDFNVWTSSEHNCENTPHFSFFKIFFMPLELIIFPSFYVIPLNSISFCSQKKFKKISWKLKFIVPKDCNHWTPNTTSKHWTIQYIFPHG